MLNFGHLSSLRGAKRRSNLDFRAFEIATAFEKGLAMTRKRTLYHVNGYKKFNGLWSWIDENPLTTPPANGKLANK